MQDRIEKEIVVRASRERVFNAIIDPAQIVKWFPDTVEGNLQEGEQAVFGFGEEWGSSSVYVVKVQPFDYFAYRWVQTLDRKGFTGDVLSRPNTLVEFHLKEEGETTIVKVTESGFAGISEEIARKKFSENTEGWGHILPLLQKYLEN